MDRDTIEGIVQKAVTDAVDFIEGEISEPRIKAQKYFDGKVDIGHEAGRSKVVATKCRDVVRAMKPALQRIFLASENVVEFMPRNADDVEMAEQMTKFANYKFMQNDGFKILSDVFQDAMVKKCGIAKVMYDSTEETEIITYENKSEEEFLFVADQDDVTVLEQTITEEVEISPDGTEIKTPIYDFKISKTKRSKGLTVVSVPPEEFFIDRNARSIEDFFVVGHRTDMTVGDLLSMGYTEDELFGLTGTMSTMQSEAEFQRRNYAVDEDDDESADPTSKKIIVTEAYMKVDAEGAGVPQLYRFFLAGSSYTMLDYEPCSHVPFAVFEVDPEPHAFFGRSVVDLVMDDQDAATAMLRGVLDNVALTNNPGLEVNEAHVAIEDLLNNEIGRIVRVSQPGSIREQVVPFTAGSTLPALQYFDSLVEAKTGVTRASQGLDADMLQSASATAVAATIDGAASQVEVMGRNLAESGMKKLFRLIADTIIRNSEKNEIMRLQGEYVEVDPSTWDSTLDLVVNVGLGTGRAQEKLATLQATLQTQMSVWQQYGPENGLVTMTNVRHTLADILAASGIKNSDRYYLPVTEQSEAALIARKRQEQSEAMAMQNQQAQPMNDPNAMLMQAEALRTQTKASVDMAKLQLDAKKHQDNTELKLVEMAAKDDLARDKLVQDIAVEVAKMMGQYGQTVDLEAIKREQDQERVFNRGNVNELGLQGTSQEGV